MYTTSAATRHELFTSTRVWSPFDEVAAAIAVASEVERHLYVERRGATYRWSLAHGGGPTPLLRISARFLDIDHRSIFIGFRTLPDGTAILCDSPEHVVEPDRWCVLDLGRPLNDAEARTLIEAELDAGVGR